MTSAATALGTRLFGGFGEGAGKDKATLNQVKKSADAISAYVMSEGLWHLTRTLPENHAIMVSLGEGLMPKAGETPEMGANPLLGFGRVYARPEVARVVDRRVRRLLNEPGHTFEQFYGWLQGRGITLWGAAVDTLENTSRFAEGKATGPMSVFHLFDSPLVLSRPYESYMGCLTVPRRVAEAADRASLLLDYRTPRAEVTRAIESAYPGVKRENIHVWTLRGKNRVGRLGKLWEEWTALGVHLVEDGWKAPSGFEVFTDSGTYAPTFLIGSWADDAGDTHVFLCDGYAATAEAMQAASLAEVLDVDASMTLFSPSFDFPCSTEGRLMALDPDRPDFAQRVCEALGGRDVDAGRVVSYAAAIREAKACNVPTGRPVLRPDDFVPEKNWRVLASTGYICDDPYTGTEGVTRVGDGVYRVTHEARRAPGLEPHRLHLPADGAARQGAPRLQPSPRPLHVGRGPHDAPGEDLRLGPDPQRAADDVLPGPRARRGDDPAPLRSSRREGRPAREAGDDPEGAGVVPGESPGLVRLDRARRGVDAEDLKSSKSG